LRKDRDRLEKLAVAANAAIVLMGLLGLLLSGRFKLSFLWFYTVLSNLLLMITSALYLLPQIRKKHPRAAGVMRYSATVSTSLTFVIVAAVFAPFGGGLRVLVEGRWLFQHLLCPLASVASFIFFETRRTEKDRPHPGNRPDGRLRGGSRCVEPRTRHRRPLPLLSRVRPALVYLRTLVHRNPWRHGGNGGRAYEVAQPGRRECRLIKKMK